ncbi:uncharacterized protein EV420DRAFT_1534947 [Desarmillaria tabescens]|uniref:Uncharacterized protein n=1 Tax=Armillaria tabescens TaxID=1929756 RepID=A0AA39KFZ8_ARMTA|nr:uncharacterized protein EV420DRAFT_1534947 [Desarmillaria tabescens]KAK0460088.1 hypothetical protein EV420DRAFT_1534947 [Desarmillaria tabescens]
MLVAVKDALVSQVRSLALSLCATLLSAIPRAPRHRNRHFYVFKILSKELTCCQTALVLPNSTRQSAAFPLLTTTITVRKLYDYSPFDSDLYPTADPRPSLCLPEPVPKRGTKAEISAHEEEAVESQVSGLKWKTSKWRRLPHTFVFSSLQ